MRGHSRLRTPHPLTTRKNLRRRPSCWISLRYILAVGLLCLCQSTLAADGKNDLFPALGDLEPGTPATTADSPSWRDQLTIGGYLKNETAYRFDEPRSITKIRNILELHGDYRFNADYILNFSGWAYHDLAYDLFDYETISGRFVRDSRQPLVFIDNLAQEKDSPVAQIRELYLDIINDNSDIRIGKQFIIWGVLEGIRVTDEINPLNFRELITPDLLDYRIPLWSVKANFYIDEDTYELIWIPDIKFHKPAPPGSEWELLQEIPNTRRPGSYRLDNSEWGLRWSSTIADTEVSLSYFWTWDDFPVAFRNARIDASIDPQFFPTYTRISLYGATFSRPLGSGILKGELAYVPDKFFGLKNSIDNNGDGFLDQQGELKRRHLRWGLGYDFSRWGADFSPALSQWIIFDYDNGLLQDQFDTALTLFVRKPLPEQSAVFQTLIIVLVNLQETYIKPKITFDITNRLQIGTGLDLFYGVGSQLGVSSAGGGVTNLTSIAQRAQFFGNFHDNDRLFVDFKYSF